MMNTVEKSRIQQMIAEPVNLGVLHCRNRLIRSATNDYRGNYDGTVSAAQIGILEELMSHQIGMVITANFYVSLDGRLDERQNGLCNSTQENSCHNLTEAAKKKACPLIAQLSHAGAKSKVMPTDKYVGQSQLANLDDELLLDEFTSAAIRAKNAGFNGVQLHCAHGYLLSELLNPMNKLPNRLRNLSFRIIESIHGSCGQLWPILIKTDATHTLRDGWTDKAYRQYWLDEVASFVEAGACAVELSCDYLGSFSPSSHNYFLEELSEARTVTTVPLIITGGIRSLEDMSLAMKYGADAVGLSRPLIRDPAWPDTLLLQGTSSSCLGCNSCYKLREKDQHRCVLN